MPKLLHRRQKYRELGLGFVSIHIKMQKEIRRPCSQCSKWIYVVELGFCRYRFAEYNYTIEHNIVALPWTEVIRKCTKHVCMKDKDSPKKIAFLDKNKNPYYNSRQENKDRIFINTHRQNDSHRMKPIFVETI